MAIPINAKEHREAIDRYNRVVDAFHNTFKVGFLPRGHIGNSGKSLFGSDIFLYSAATIVDILMRMDDDYDDIVPNITYVVMDLIPICREIANMEARMLPEQIKNELIGVDCFSYSFLQRLMLRPFDIFEHRKLVDQYNRILKSYTDKIVNPGRYASLLECSIDGSGYSTFVGDLCECTAKSAIGHLNYIEEEFELSPNASYTIDRLQSVCVKLVKMESRE